MKVDKVFTGKIYCSDCLESLLVCCQTIAFGLALLTYKPMLDATVASLLALHPNGCRLWLWRFPSFMLQR